MANVARRRALLDRRVGVDALSEHDPPVPGMRQPDDSDELVVVEPLPIVGKPLLIGDCLLCHAHVVERVELEGDGGEHAENAQ